MTAEEVTFADIPMCTGQWADMLEDDPPPNPWKRPDEDTPRKDARGNEAPSKDARSKGSWIRDKADKQDRVHSDDDGWTTVTKKTHNTTHRGNTSQGRRRRPR